MRTTFLFFFIVLFGGMQAQNGLWLVDPLEAIYPDSNDVSSYNTTWGADFPANSFVDVHVLIRLPQEESFTVKGQVNGKLIPTSFWSVLIEVPVEENTGLDSRTEQFKNTRNPYVVRRAPFQIFEVIKPLESLQLSSTQPYTALRLAIPADYFASAGKQQVEIIVSTDGQELSALFTPVIHPATIPSLEESRFFYTNWFNLKRMEEKHQVARWTDAWFATLERYAALMAHGRQNCIIVPSELISLQNGRISLDEEKMWRFIEVFKKRGFTYFESFSSSAKPWGRG